jgi:hypothetical protein
VCVYISYAEAEKAIIMDKAKNFLIFGHPDAPQFSQFREDCFAPPHMTEENFTDHEWMRQNTPFRQQLQHDVVGGMQMIDPNRRINKDHAAFGRRRGGSFARESLPPSNARRRAASRSTSDSRAILISVGRSLMPV